MRFLWHSWIGRIGLAITAFFAVLILFVLFCFYTPPGHRVVEGLAERLSGGKVAMSGLSGALPDHMAINHLEVRDKKGAWLVIEGARLDWHALAAIGNHIKIDRVAAKKVTVLRKHIAGPSSSTSTTVIDVGDLTIPRIELKPAVLGRAAVLSAQGSLRYVSRHDLTADLALRRLDAAGRYDVRAAVARDVARGTVTIAEEGDGLAGGLVGLPDLGPVTLDIRATPQGTSTSLSLRFTANLLNVFAGGVVDLAKENADLDFSAVSPDMHPNKALSWAMISARGHIHGAFSAPDIDAKARIKELMVNTTRLASVEAEVAGRGGIANLHMLVTGLMLSSQNVFAAAPLELTAKFDLAESTHPLQFMLRHPLLQLSGNTTTHLPMAGHVSLTLPSLQGLAPLTGAKLNGTAAAVLDFKKSQSDTELNIKGTVNAQGDSMPAKLLGVTKLDGTAHLNPAGDITLQVSLKGAAVRAEISGSQRDGRQSFSGEATLSDLSRLASTLAGTLSLRGNLIGPAGDAKLDIRGTALAATKGMAKQTVDLALTAAGLPKLKTANLRLSGRFGGAPVSVKADVKKSGEALNIALTEAAWRSARAQGTLAVAGNAPRGSLRLSVAKLGDLSSLTGTNMAGSLNAYVDFQNGNAVLHAAALNIVSGSMHLDRADLSGNIVNPLASPVLALSLDIPKLTTPAVSGSASAHVSGPLNAITANLQTALSTTSGQNFTVAVDALADTAGKHVTVSRFQGVWRDQTVTLAAPASIDYANGLKFAASFIEGKAAQVTLVGFVPAAPSQPMNVHATGTADLAVIGSGMASIGQAVRGRIAADVTLTGSAAKPNVSGSITLSDAQIHDFTRGVSLTDINAVAEAQGTFIRLTKFTAKAGPGTVTGSGTIDVAAPGTPVDVTFKASNARPLSSDLLTANLDSDLKLAGHLSEGLRLSGQINVREANINIPDKFPAEVVTLNVRRSHAAPPPAPPPPVTHIVLDLSINSPGQIFVRGRGLEAEFEGNLKIGGTTAAPQVEGGLDLRRGVFSLAGATLTFQSGKITFNGQTLRKRLDPSLNLVAQSEANGITATLKVTGTASQPKIELSSSPQLPQDEILSQLLFQQSAKSLSAMQLASVAQAAASLGGSGAGFDPVGTVRRSLGLDRLAVGSNQEGNSGSGSTTIEAGKYVLRNVYLGAKQDLAGGTKALVQVDITKHLKAQAQVNTGAKAATTTSTPLQDNGDSIGLSYQFEY